MGTFLPFGEWLPDLPTLGNPGAKVAKNVIPDTRSYLPFPQLHQYSTSMANRVRGALIARDTAGNYYNYAGDTTRLYSLSNVVWQNVTRLSGDYNTSDEDYWEFTQ